MKKLAGLILMLAMVGRAATVTGPIYDSSSNAVNTVVTFVPKSTPQVIGPSLILDVQRTVKPTNGNFSIFLVGGFYESQYGTYSKPLRILVPPNDTNTYTIGFCANLASNAATFTWTNFTGRISERVLPGINVVFQTNHAGAANESLTVSSAASGGGGDTVWTNDHSSGTAYLLANVPLQIGDMQDLFSGNSSANVNSRLLNDTTGNPAEDWGVRTLIAGDGTTSVNWASRLLADTSSLTAIDWSNRRMKNASGTTLLDWSGASLNGNGALLTNIPGIAISSAVATATKSTYVSDIGTNQIPGSGVTSAVANATSAVSATSATTATKATYAADVSTNTIPGSGVTNPIGAAAFPALTGDITTSSGSLATALKSTGTAGTYTKTTFDAQGRETSGTTLSAGDIPTLTVAKLSDAGTAAYSNSTAFAPAQSGTIVTQNNSFALVLSNSAKMDAAHSLSLSNLTASRLVFAGADNTLGSAAASGAVPVNADGSTTTSALVNALFPGFVVTNGNNNAIVLFTNNQVSLSVNSSGVPTLTNYAAAALGMVMNTNGTLLSFSSLTNKIFGLIECTNAANSSASKVGNIQQNLFGYLALSGSTGMQLGHGAQSADMTIESGVVKPPNDLQSALGQSNLRWSQLFTTNVATITVVASGAITATNGFASYASDAKVALTATGLTNSLGKNATAYVTATSVAFTIKNAAQTNLYTSPVLTATIAVQLQNGWSVNAASGLAGTLIAN